jgi:MoxR-like ATPase
VLPDDVKGFAGPALVHRLILDPGLWLKRQAANEVIESIVQRVAVPVIDGV